MRTLLSNHSRVLFWGFIIFLLIVFLLPRPIMAAAGDITTAAGGGTRDGGPAASTRLGNPGVVAPDAGGLTAAYSSQFTSKGLPVISSAIYDASTGVLEVTGVNFVSSAGLANDVDVSLLTLRGGSNETWTLTDSSDVEITSDTSFTLTLSDNDRLNVNGVLNRNGLVSGSGIVYNLEAADNWMTGSPAASDIADTIGNGIMVINVQTPTITSALYDYSAGVFTVTGTNLCKKPGANNDVDLSCITITGGVANTTYTLTTTQDVEISSATGFSFTLTGADKANVDALLDQLGTASTGGTTYNIALADNWLTAADPSADIEDAGPNEITVSIPPSITSATYNASTGVLVVTGTNILANGAGADIDASMFTLTGEGGATHTLSDTADVERDSIYQFTLTLGAADRAAVNQILNKNGTVSTGGTTYNLAAADDWATSVTSGDTSDTIISITVSNVAVPAITSATYNASTGHLVVTGTNFLVIAGAANDIVANKFTFTGEGGASCTLTDTANVDITSGTMFTLILSETDKSAVCQIFNKNGTSSNSGTTYNLAAAEDWAAGADSAVSVADFIGNGITVSDLRLPAVSTQAVSSIGLTTATGNGTITDLGVPNPSQHGFVWSTASGPTIAGDKTTGGAVSTTGAFTGSLTGLSAGTQYYVRAYATSPVGTVYGDEVTFITLAEISVTGITAADKVYDGTVTATLDLSGAALVGVKDGDTVTLDTGSVAGTFSDKNVGANKPVTVSGLTLSGADKDKYNLTPPTANASITARALTVSGIRAANKWYDGNTTATLYTAGAVLEGVIAGEDAILDVSAAAGAFADAGVGSGKTVFISGLTIDGPDKDNYSLTQPTTTASIMALPTGDDYPAPTPTPTPTPTPASEPEGRPVAVINEQSGPTALDADGNSLEITGRLITMSGQDNVLRVNIPVALADGATLSSFTDSAGIKFEDNRLVITASAATGEGLALLIEDENGDLGTEIIIETGDFTGSGSSASAEVKAIKSGASFTERDFSDEEPALGRVASSVNLHLKTLPNDAKIKITTSRQADPKADSAFQLAAANASMGSINVAYTLNIEKTNLANGTDIHSASITMIAGREWVEANGGVDTVRIIRYDNETGTSQVLETRFLGYDDEGRAIFEGISPEGLSVFALAGVKPVAITTPPVVNPVIPVAPISPTDPARTETTTPTVSPTGAQPDVGDTEGNYWWILWLVLGLTAVGSTAWVYLRGHQR